MNELPFYVEELSPDLNSYELKMFRIQHDETQLTKYLCKLAKEHQTQSINKTFLVREKGSKNLVAFFCLKAATLPYNDKDEIFLIPAVELTHFAVDERYKDIFDKTSDIKTGEVIFWNFIIPYINEARHYIAIKDLYIFAINNPKLINYYKDRLGFHEIEKIEDKCFFEYAKPEYDDYCKFLYFPLY